MRFPDLQAWLAWQETLHPSEIELGLDRLRTVLARMDLSRPGFPVLSVAGTNGKGSTVAFLEAFLRAAGYRTGAY
ncbi:MAG: bifunctional folylpolyglutamate synthase/dihydrofolate synthase, partial [Gammaproteobacteria bacterium]